MFTKKLKLKAGVLAITISFLSVVSCNAVGRFDLFYINHIGLVQAEAFVIKSVKDYENKTARTYSSVQPIFDEFEKEKPYWSRCLVQDKTKFNCPENGHPELYYLWLVEEFNKIYRTIEQTDKTSELIAIFVKRLLVLTENMNKGAWFYHEFVNMSVNDLAKNLAGIPSCYKFDVFNNA